MKIEKRKRKVFTFHSSTDVTIFRRYCEEKNLPGRIIPVPRSISSSCGSSWMIDYEEYDNFISEINKSDMKYENIYDVML